MKPEIEAKFLDADHDELRVKLNEMGAECVQPMRLMRRKNYDFPNQRLNYEKNGWVRVRDEGDKVTMSYKQLDSRKLDGTHEVNMTVGSFEAADSFLGEIGLETKTYQETKRESWRLNDFEIELDEWPWAKPYVEIEGPDEESLKTLATKLGLDWSKACHGSVEIVYRAEYDVTDEAFNALPVVTFEGPVPAVLKKRQKSE